MGLKNPDYHYNRDSEWFIEWEKEYAKKRALQNFSNETELFLAKNLVRVRNHIFLQTFAKESGLPIHFLIRSIENDVIPCSVFPSRTTELIKNTYRLFVDMERFKKSKYYNEIIEIIIYSARQKNHISTAISRITGKKRHLLKNKICNNSPNKKRVVTTSPPDTVRVYKNQIMPVRINIPMPLWAGKTPQSIFNELSTCGYENDLISLVINEKCACTKTDKGRPFLPDGSDDNVYRRKFDRLVEKAKLRYILTYDR